MCSIYLWLFYFPFRVCVVCCMWRLEIRRHSKAFDRARSRFAFTKQCMLLFVFVTKSLKILQWTTKNLVQNTQHKLFFRYKNVWFTLCIFAYINIFIFIVIRKCVIYLYILYVIHNFAVCVRCEMQSSTSMIAFSLFVSSKGNYARQKLCDFSSRWARRHLLCWRNSRVSMRSLKANEHEWCEMKNIGVGCAVWWLRIN